MSAETSIAKGSKADLEKARKRKIAWRIGGVVGATALVAGILLFSGNAKADEGKRLKAPPRKTPEKTPKKKLPKTPKPPKTPKGGGGGKNNGGTEGPGGGGGGKDGANRTNPDGGNDGANRTNPDDGSKDGSNRTNPKPVGPDPGPEDLPDYYNDENPDPGGFYQVTHGGEDAKGLLNIANRYALTSLFLAARNVGGLSRDEAIAWAQANAPGPAKLREWADYILCVAWNDVHYGSFRVTSNNRRGPHGRGIPFSPMHADNWRRIREGRSTLRNVRLHSANESGTPSNLGQGDQKLPLMWMPQLDERVLWESGGKVLRAGGNWANGYSYYFPPPIVMRLSIEDPTDANLGIWGCGEGEADYG
ncbi:MAG: hypothetical protein ACRBN8_19650 [Nannocystales bacterium]